VSGRACQWRAGHSHPSAGRSAQPDNWPTALPDNQQDSATAEALRAIVEFDLSELLAIEASAEIEQRDGPISLGHDDAWEGDRLQLVPMNTRGCQGERSERDGDRSNDDPEIR
jgi:hypothetical protein